MRWTVGLVLIATLLGWMAPAAWAFRSRHARSTPLLHAAFETHQRSLAGFTTGRRRGVLQRSQAFRQRSLIHATFQAIHQQANERFPEGLP